MWWRIIFDSVIQGDTLITLNGKDLNEDFGEISVTDLLIKMKYTYPMLIVRVNGRVIQEESFKDTLIKNGDRVEAIHLVAGG